MWVIMYLNIHILCIAQVGNYVPKYIYYVQYRWVTMYLNIDILCTVQVGNHVPKYIYIMYSTGG